MKRWERPRQADVPHVLHGHDAHDVPEHGGEGRARRDDRCGLGLCLRTVVRDEAEARRLLHPRLERVELLLSEHDEFHEVRGVALVEREQCVARIDAALRRQVEERLFVSRAEL